MAKLTNKQHEQQQDRRITKIERRDAVDERRVNKLEKRVATLENELVKLKTKSQR